MTKSAIAFVAAVLLSAAPAAALEVRAPFADLDLSSVAGVEGFDARADAAARSVCAIGPRGIVNDNCVRQVQHEAIRALPAARRDDFVCARCDECILAMAAPAWPG